MEKYSIKTIKVPNPQTVGMWHHAAEIGIMVFASTAFEDIFAFTLYRL